jgi:hypothetical protein
MLRLRTGEKTTKTNVYYFFECEEIASEYRSDIPNVKLG